MTAVPNPDSEVPQSVRDEVFRKLKVKHEPSRRRPEQSRAEETTVCVTQQQIRSLF